MKVKLGVWIRDMGDGSMHPVFFKSAKDAEKYADRYEEECDWAERLCDDVISVELEFDKNGKLLNPYDKNGFNE